MKLKKLTGMAACFAIVLTLSGAEKIFDLSFNDYTVTPRIAKGGKAQQGFGNPDLQLRMYNGTNNKGNALNLGNSEKLSYNMKGNFNPKQGTVILWIAPHNWKLSQSNYQLFFQAAQSRYTFFIAKTWSNYILANIKFNIPWQGKKYFSSQVQARLDPVTWTRGQYHQIAVTWTDRTMNLYINGRCPAKTPLHVGKRNVAPTVPARKFTVPVTFPEANGRIHLGGNPWIRNKHIDKNHSTSFDQVTIYDSALTPLQIRAEYEKIVPPKKKSIENVLTIPLLKGNGKLTGDLSDPAWKKAAKVPVMPIRTAPAQNISALIWHDNKDLHVGFSTDIPCQKRVYTKRDQSLWEDDVFEFHLRTEAKDYYHYLVNGNGVIFDQLNRKPAWNGKAKVAVKHNKKGWTAELVIPLSEFNAKAFDSEFCAASRPGIYYHMYRWGGTGNQFAPAGKMILAKNADTFRLDTIGDPESAKLNMKGFSTNPAQLRILIDGEPPRVIPIAKGRFAVAPRLQSGLQTLELSSRGLLWRKEIVVRQPLSLSFDFQMWDNILKTQVDFSSADDATKALIKKGLDVRVAVKDNKGKVIAAKTVKTKKSGFTVSLKLPADLPEGLYTIEAKAGKITSSIPLRRPDLTPYKVKLGADNTVPVPWTPVKQLSAKKFRVWGRTYEFNDSPLPQQITHGNDNLLKAAPVWKLDGKAIKWDSFRIVKKAQDKVTFTGKAKAGKISFNWQGELWFDGAYILKMELSPDGIAPIRDFGFTYAVAPVASRYAMNPEYVRWVNNKVSFQLGPGKGRKDNLLWLSGVDKGVMVWTESNANWVIAPKTAPLTAVRTKDKTDVAVQIINKKVKLGKKAKYTFVFMGTPSRPFPERHRAVNYHGYHFNPHTTHVVIGQEQFHARDSVWDPFHFNSPYPAYPEKFKKSVESYDKRNGARLHFYTMPGVLNNSTADSDYWSKTLRTIPEEAYGSVKKNVRSIATRTCTRVSSAPADHWTWITKRLLDDIPKMGGLYFDCASTNFCANEQHGCSGIDAFGQPYVSSDALGFREFFMRVYKVHKRYKGKTMMIHSHVQFLPFLHSFTDFFAPGENSCYAIYRNQEYPYTEEVSLEEYQTDYNSRKAGVAYCMILQNSRAANIMPSLNPYVKKYQREPIHAIRAITPFLVHDVNVWDTFVHRKTIIRYWKMRKDVDIGSVTRFIGYWEKDCPVKAVTPKVYASVYEWNGKAPYRRAIAVGNFLRNEQSIGLKIDWKTLGVAKPATVRELWTGKDIPVSELENYKLKGAHFALFGIK